MTQEEYDSRTCKEILPSGEVCGKIPHQLAKRKDGVIKRKPYHCTEHHREELAKKHNQPTYAILVHPYLKNRKDYCENVDGRLGYKCTTTIVYRGQLEVDHIDGNPYNHSKENLQTLCNCCHTYKTHICRDRETPGRKTLKKKMKFKKSKKSSKKKIKKPTIFENLFEYG